LAYYLPFFPYFTGPNPNFQTGLVFGGKVTGHGGIWIINPQGEYIGLIEVPERVGNLNWGGKNWDILYIAASTSIYRLKMKVKGNQLNYMN
jgi:sugar lactone lactonase YvrE